MKIQINKLGPITRASTLDLDKRFMVFVGENESGKTYVAQLIFWLLRANSLISPKKQGRVNLNKLL